MEKQPSLNQAAGNVRPSPVRADQLLDVFQQIDEAKKQLELRARTNFGDKA